LSLRSLLLQICRYAVSGGAAAATHLAVLIALVEVFALPATPASAAGFAGAMPVNYLLQHHYVFHSASQHVVTFPRYLGVTLATLALNTLVFWLLAEMLGIFYVASQVLTICIIVPVNFVLNRLFTFASLPRELS
jgi:putative flippase GtrA